MSADWATTEEAAAIAELTAKNRDLANEKDKYLTIFESIQDPVFILDNAGRIENMNAAAWRLLGINGEPGELYYRRDGQFPAREQIEAQLTDLSLQDNTTVTLQTPLGQRSFDIRRREILDIGNKYSGSVVIFNDVTTHLQALEKQAQANRIKTSFLATVSHEIRTPMNGILGAVHLLLDGSLSPQQQSYAEAIARSGKRLHAFINNVLDYSKIEAGRLELEISTFSISETLDNVIAIMAPQATELGLALHLDTSALPKTTVSGDPGKLQQVLLNLISNALKFTERGQVRVRVQLEP
ncbi:MAG: PAS domain-containing protein, partial [Candidatus Competibacteraceae bacterium]|nr:PAS domain-containing protein [Candidatus Competibacteraceae bacterium]